MTPEERRSRLIEEGIAHTNGEADEELEHFERMSRALGLSHSRRASSRKPRTYTPNVPRSWHEKSAVLFEGYRPLQRSILEAFGLTDPADVSELGALLEPLADTTFGTSAYLVGLKYPTSDGEAALTFEYVQAPDYPTGVELEDAWKRDYEAWQAAQPLSHLYNIARSIERDTGTALSAIVGFLLADAPVVLPWIEVRERRGAFGPRYTIEVGTSDVTAEDVRAAYNTAKATRRSEKASTVSLVRFVDDRTPDEGHIPWVAIWKEWNALPGVTHYKTWRSLKSTYEKAKRRRGDESR